MYLTENLLYALIGVFVFAFYLVLTTGIVFLIPTVKHFKKFSIKKRHKLTRAEQIEYSDSIFNLGYVSLLIFSGISGLVYSDILYLQSESYVGPVVNGILYLSPLVVFIAISACLQLYAIDLKRNSHNVGMHIGIAGLLACIATFFSATTASL